MNKKMKKRLGVISGLVVITLILTLAIVGGNTAAKSVSVAEAASGSMANQKVQVSGNVVDSSFSTEGSVLTFQVYDPEGDPQTTLTVRYDGAASATFGNDVTAICTGRIGADGVLSATEMVTKCPSKYENADAALGVTQLLGYGEEVVGTVVKVRGAVKANTLVAAGQGDRFVVVDADETGVEMPVLYDGALSDEVVDGAVVVLTGFMTEDGKFAATDVALEA